MAKKSDKLVKELADLYGGRFADVLNALWLRGVPMDQLTRALATTQDGTNDATDIVARLLNSGVNPDMIRGAVGTPAPAGTQFAFIGTGDKAKIVAHTNPPPPLPASGPGGIFGQQLGIAQQAAAPPALVGAPAAYQPLPAPANQGRISPDAGGPTAGYGGGQTPAAMPAAKPATPDEIRAQVQSQYGWAAALQDIPDVAKILNDAANGAISIAEVGNLFRGTNYYRTTTEAERNWTVLEKSSPADATARKDQQRLAVQAQAAKLGLDPNNPRLNQIADMTLRYGWNDQQVAQALASEVRFDPSGQQRGVLAQLQQAAREYVLPLSPDAMTAWASGIVAGTRTADDFVNYARDQAKSLFPGMAGALDDPNMTVRKYLDPYAQDTAKLLGMNPDDIDWNDTKWQRAVNQIDPKTGVRTVMSREAWQRTLMADPVYNFDQTANGKAQQAGLARNLLQRFGLAPTGG